MTDCLNTRKLCLLQSIYKKNKKTKNHLLVRITKKAHKIHNSIFKLKLTKNLPENNVSQKKKKKQLTFSGIHDRINN